MKIHHVSERREERARVAGVPELGLEWVTVHGPSSIDRVVHGAETFEVQPDMTFDVSDPVGAFLVGRRMGDGVWKAGPNPFYVPSGEPEKPRAKARKPAAS